MALGVGAALERRADGEPERAGQDHLLPRTPDVAAARGNRLIFALVLFLLALIVLSLPLRPAPLAVLGDLEPLPRALLVHARVRHPALA